MSETLPTVLLDSVSDAARLLKQGKLVAFPTETVYGLGADARNPDSVAGIFESKGRPSFDPLIVHVLDQVQAQSVVGEFPETARTLTNEFWPGPLTLVLPKRDNIPDLVTAGLPGVGVRVPRHPIAQELLKQVERPLAAPSANPFGGISPTTAQHVLDGLSGRIDAVLDGGACEVGVESTVLSLMGPTPMLLRPGGITVEQIEGVLKSSIEIARSDHTKEDESQPAPGMLSRHYAPKTPLRLIAPDADAVPETSKTGLLTYGQNSETTGIPFAEVVNLGPGDHLRTCAANLFAGLRSLDSAGLDAIIARRFVESGLGVALNDRLQRAASR